jgi:hypothetical protein
VLRNRETAQGGASTFSLKKDLENIYDSRAKARFESDCSTKKKKKEEKGYYTKREISWQFFFGMFLMSSCISPVA